MYQTSYVRHTQHPPHIIHPQCLCQRLPAPSAKATHTVIPPTRNLRPPRMHHTLRSINSIPLGAVGCRTTATWPSNSIVRPSVIPHMWVLRVRPTCHEFDDEERVGKHLPIDKGSECSDTKCTNLALFDTSQAITLRLESVPSVFITRSQTFITRHLSRHLKPESLHLRVSTPPLPFAALRRRC